METEPSAEQDRRASRGAWALGIAATLLWIGPFVLRGDVYDGDARQHVYWTYKYADASLFQDDLVSDFFASGRRRSGRLPRSLLGAGAPLTDAQLAGELLGAALLAATLGLAVLIGRQLDREHPSLAGMTMLLVVLAAILELNVLPPMGMQRAFGLPLTLAAVLAMLQRRLILLGFVFVAATLFLPGHLRHPGNVRRRGWKRPGSSGREGSPRAGFPERCSALPPSGCS